MACRVRALTAAFAILFASYPVASAPTASDADTPPSSFPHQYPGQPSGDFSPAWQSYFQVTEKLPGVSFGLDRNFAGNLPVQRPNHPNDTLFFWGFEKSPGSLTAAAGERATDPWGIWLNGGPGSSSLIGQFGENGPIHVDEGLNASSNPHSWHKLADYFWLDQPVGVGFSTADSKGYISDEDQMATDFFGFLSNLVKVFPSLAARPLYLTGESYAGTYIPYILKKYFELPNPPVKIAKVAIGNGAMNDEQAFELLPALTLIETFPQLISYDVEVYRYFKEQSHLCNYDVNLTYPQRGIIPPVAVVGPKQRVIPFELRSKSSSKQFMAQLQKRYEAPSFVKRDLVDRQEDLTLWKRDLSGRAHGTLDPWYGCFLFDMLLDYALNFTYPWNANTQPNFNVYDIPDALSPSAPMDPTEFLNRNADWLFTRKTTISFEMSLDPQTRAAIHAPTSKNWTMSINYVFGVSADLQIDPSPVPMTFLTDLATNTTKKEIGVVFYSGNDDALIPHFGTEIVIQNTTFGGIQGFTRKPSTPWFNDEGQFAGIVHQERGWTFATFYGASHLVPRSKPAEAFTFLREFILGKNTTGLVVTSGNSVNVVGGENSTLAAKVLPAADGIYAGAGTTQTTYVFPEATRSAWKSFIFAETVTRTAVVAASTATTKTSTATRTRSPPPHHHPHRLAAAATTLLLCAGCAWL